MEENKEVSFEEKLRIVQDLIQKIESGKLPLEDSVRQYEQGMKMLNELDQELGNMNRRISVLQDGKETVPDHADI